MIVDAKVETEPIAWILSKVHRISPNGLVNVTLAQDKFDQQHDYIERDENGKIIGMWADYFSSKSEPKDKLHIEFNTNVYSKITHSGLKPQLKVGGSYKTFTVDYYNSENEIISHDIGSWKFYIDNEDVTNIFDSPITILTPSLSNALSDNQIKVKFSGSYDYIGKQLKIVNTIEGITSEILVDIVGM